MGYKKPERRDLCDLFGAEPSLKIMQRQGWRIMARCTSCHIDMRVQYEVAIYLNGADFKLWGKSARCRRWGCDGRTIFMTSPPGWADCWWPMTRQRRVEAATSVIKPPIR